MPKPDVTSPGLDGGPPVKSADRVLRVLEHLAEQQEPATLADLARHLDIPKSSLHALLRTMHRRGWLEEVGSDQYGLGVRALLVGTTYVDADDVVTLSSDTMDWLADALGETIHLGRLDRTDIVYLAKRESSHPLRLFSAIGRRLPAYTTSLGKSLLAERLEGDYRSHLPRRLTALTPNTHTSRESLLADLQATSERGHARDNEENMVGLVCLGVALPTADPPQDALSCSIPVTRLSPEVERRIVDHLHEARNRIAARLSVPTAVR